MVIIPDADAKPTKPRRRASALARLQGGAVRGTSTLKVEPKIPAPKPATCTSRPLTEASTPRRALVSQSQRAFDSYCERAQQTGRLTQEGLDVLLHLLVDVAVDTRDSWMLDAIEKRLCGEAVEVVGVTGRHPRGWWGDGSVGIVQSGVLFDTRTPGLVPVLLQVSNTTRGTSESALVGISALNLRLCVTTSIGDARPEAGSSRERGSGSGSIRSDDCSGSGGGGGCCSGCGSRRSSGGGGGGRKRSVGGSGTGCEGGSGDGSGEGSGVGSGVCSGDGTRDGSVQAELHGDVVPFVTDQSAAGQGLSLNELVARGQKLSQMIEMWRACMQLQSKWVEVCAIPQLRFGEMSRCTLCLIA